MYLLYKRYACFTIIWLESVSLNVYRVIPEGRWSTRTVYRDGFSSLASPLGGMAVGRGESLVFTHGSPPSLTGSWQRYRVSCSTCCTHYKTKNISTTMSLNPPTLSEKPEVLLKPFYIPFSKSQSPLGVGNPHVLSCLRQVSCLKNSRCQNSPRSATSTHYPALRPSTPLPASVSLRTNAKAGLRSAVSYPDSLNTKI